MGSGRAACAELRIESPASHSVAQPCPVSGRRKALRSGGKQRGERLDPGGVFSIETRGERAVEVDHRDRFAAPDRRHDQLRTARRIAGDMAGKRMDVVDQLGRPLDAAAPQTPWPRAMRMQAGLPHEGAEHKCRRPIMR